MKHEKDVVLEEKKYLGFWVFLAPAEDTPTLTHDYMINRQILSTPRCSGEEVIVALWIAMLLNRSLKRHVEFL